MSNIDDCPRCKALRAKVIDWAIVIASGIIVGVAALYYFTE
jgi:hypothetical protein